MQIYCLVLLATVAYAIDTVDVESKGVISQKAPSSFQNCDCQCSHYTWRDSYGKKQGNCRSSDNTGAQWCYTNSNSCTDLKYSKNRRDSYGSVRRWSYQACSTPSRRSNKCSNYGNGGGFGQGGGQGNGGHNGGHGNGGHGNGFGNGNNHNNNNGFNGNNQRYVAFPDVIMSKYRPVLGRAPDHNIVTATARHNRPRRAMLNAERQVQISGKTNPLHTT
jgi:hypothetical protein